MKIIVTYEFDASFPYPYFARTVIGGSRYITSGESFEEAESVLLKKITLSKTVTVPEPKEIEL